MRVLRVRQLFEVRSSEERTEGGVQLFYAPGESLSPFVAERTRRSLRGSEVGFGGIIYAELWILGVRRGIPFREGFSWSRCSI